MSQGNQGAPFLSFESFSNEGVVPRDFAALATPAARSPFVSVYELDEAEGGYDQPLREAYAQLVNELHDEEFEEAVDELVNDARNLHQSELEAGRSVGEADRLISQHFSQLSTHAETAVDSLAREFGSRPESEILSHEVESFAESYVPPQPVEPAFENFLGKLLKKVGKVANAAISGVKKLGLGLILGKLRAVVRPFLNRVLQKAIGWLPAAVRPAAQQLAVKLGLATPQAVTPAAAPAPAVGDAAGATAPTADAAAPAAPAPDAAQASPAPDAAAGAAPGGTPVQPAAGTEVAELQQELDQRLAEAVLAENELELELEFARERVESERGAPAFATLDEARERFIQELTNLKPGESAEPLIQNFLPAILPVLRIAVRIVGRNRLIGILAPLLAKLVSRFIDKAQASALSRAIVDSGFKLLGLEASEEEQAGLAASAVAATVEETAYRVASLPSHVLENEELLEAYALEAFEQAAAANLPAVLAESEYAARPELLEAGENAAWVHMPMRGRKRYKRCSKSFRIRVTPHMAREVETFESTPLSEFLHEQLGLAEGAEVQAEVHLYETLPGTTVADIARSESESGLGQTDEATVAQLHPLTPQAASVLLGRPGLGRALADGINRRNLAIGQRLYHLAIPGARPLSVLGPRRRYRVRRLAHLNVVLDATRDQIRVTLYLSEVRAQRLAVKLRQQSHAGSLAVGFHKFLARRLPAVLRGRHRRRLRVVDAAQPAAAPNFGAVSEAVYGQLTTKLEQWLAHGYAEFLKHQTQEYLAAADDPADGVTLRFVLERPQGLKELCAALGSKAAPDAKLAELLGGATQPVVKVEVLPGHRCG